MTVRNSLYLSTRLTISIANRLSIFTTFKHLLPLLHHPEEYIPVLAAQFGQIGEHQTRVSLASAFAELSKNAPDMVPVVPLLLDLNAFSNKSLDEYNFDRRLAAYAQINEKLVKYAINRGFL